jgi:N-methylhydantoinase A
MPFGGAGPLHAAALAQELGITRILCPRASGVLSAVGLAAAAPRRDVSRTVMVGAAEMTTERLGAEREALLEEAARALGSPPARVRIRHELRYRGQSFELAVEQAGSPEMPLPPADASALREEFERVHEERYGYREREAEVELVTIRASAFGPSPGLRPAAADGPAPARGTCEITFDGEPVRALLQAGAPQPGERLSGPAVCGLGESTLLIPEGWSGEVDAYGTIHLGRGR